MGLEQLNFEGKNKVESAIELLQACEPPQGYYLAFSGGKDSVVIYNLAFRAGVKFDAHYCVSPIDPREIQQFIKQYYPNVAWDYHAKGFWKMVTKRGLPRRKGRWCCEVIKEAGGEDRTVMVGNRRLEGGSGRRRHQKCFEKHTKRNIIFVRPILYWDFNEVWEYIRNYNLHYCCLYDEGAERKGYGDGFFKRLGCVLCPFVHDTAREIERFPKIAKLWRLSCDRIVERRKATGKTYKLEFNTGQELWEWFLDRQ